MTQNLSQFFSYTFVFLLGMLVGAVGELIWHGLSGKRESSQDNESGFAEENNQVGDTFLPTRNAQEDHPFQQELENENTSQQGLVSPQFPKTNVQAKTKKTNLGKTGKPMSIIEQVDDILQDLQRSDKNNQETIKLSDDGHQGVLVRIGSQTFSGIDAVDDSQAQGLIRQAVAEWERRNSK